MNDERSSSPAPGNSVPAAPVEATSPSGANRGQSSLADAGRMPSIPGLVPPRIPNRGPLDTLRSSNAQGEPQGLMRPHLPIRKPMPSPPATLVLPEAPPAPGDAATPAESDLFAGVPVQPSSRPRKLAPPPKPPTVASPTVASNSSGTGLAPRRRPTPAPHNVSTITAMRIISIGVEDNPPPSEYIAPSSPPELDDEPGAMAVAAAPLPSFEISEQAPPMPELAPLPAIDVPLSVQPALAHALAPLPAFDLPELGEPIEPAELGAGTAIDTAHPDEPDAQAPLPAFDLPEPEPETQEIATAPLPAFEMPEGEPPQDEAAIAPLPAFEILKPVEAPQDLELVPLAPPPFAEPPFEQPPPLPTKTAAVEPVELAEDDVAPDSIQPGPPEPPSRTATAKVAVTEPVKPEPPVPPSRAAAASAPSLEVSQAETDSSEVVGATTKRNPPPPPRRSFPAPNEVLAAATGVEPAAASKGSAAAQASVEPSKAEDKAAARTRRPWWEELFNEDYSRAMSRLSDEQIKREASFIEESLGVAQGGVLLDLGCGPGYHAVELAERGYAVVGYDLSLHQLALAADVAQERNQKLNLMQGDMREMAFEAVFDGIYCWNTTFGYFEEEKNLVVAERIFKALKPGGTFLVNVINRDFVAMQQPSSVWFEGDSAVCMDDMTVDFITSRLRVKRSVMLDDGRTRECPYSIRLYSLHELGKLLHDVGFRVAEASGDPSTPGVFMGQNAPRIIILAQRP